ncbi:MAG: PBP1A family penicillin-binding protein [Candidatus Obscuribacterales bacterium]|nr:PBP1A family penicillin-binding protein [Candidatus Obscuribacterales bacterium]
MPFTNFERSRAALKAQETISRNQQNWYFWLRKFFYLISVLASLAIAFLGFKVGMHLMQVPNLNFLNNYNPVQTVQIYDRHDKLVVSVDGTEKRIIVPLSAVSKNMRMALLAAEDHHFYEHHGVSYIGILRAIFSNLSHGKVREGGSTITQQLAKNLFFEGEKRSLDLKIAELLIATSIENQFSKDKILELYLNEIYFGNNAYGIEQAARNYFGKKAKQLSTAESAFLAGIIRSPSSGGSKSNRSASERRQQEVIEKMFEYGFIDQSERNRALQEWLRFSSLEVKEEKMKITRYPYYVGAVLDSLRGEYNAASIEKQGLRVYTNLDTVAQDTAERTLAQGLARAPYGVNQGALVSIRIADGAVMALVGGVGNYENNQWNCATNPHTAGSAFKPFVYLAAFEKGLIEEYSTVDDTPFAISDSNGKEYKPKNYDGKFLGGITVAKAFAYSRNIPALRIGQAAGIDAVISAAERAGISEPLAPELSLALGCSAVSPLHLANAYATLARGGVFMTPSLIRRVETRTGRVLDYFQAEQQTVFDRNAVAQVVDLMQDCVAEGTGQLAKLADRPVAGKTGTADQGKDLWFVGFTPDMVTAVWGGNKENKAVGGSVTGGTVMAGIWRNYEQAYYRQVKIPAGCFIASNRPPQSLGSDIAVENRVAAPKRIIETASYRAYKRSRRRSARQYNYRQAPAGGAIVRADRGVKEYAWSRR